MIGCGHSDSGEVEFVGASGPVAAGPVVGASGPVAVAVATAALRLSAPSF